jgi:DNA-binding transcriptional ArsR family regulator
VNIKDNYHPNAYMDCMKNVKSGLMARTKILDFLEKQPFSAGGIAQDTRMSYASVMHHLRLLEVEGKACRKGQRPCIWKLTGLGQSRLVS